LLSLNLKMLRKHTTPKDSVMDSNYKAERLKLILPETIVVTAMTALAMAGIVLGEGEEEGEVVDVVVVVDVDVDVDEGEVGEEAEEEAVDEEGVEDEISEFAIAPLVEINFAKGEVIGDMKEGEAVAGMSASEIIEVAIGEDMIGEKFAEKITKERQGRNLVVTELHSLLIEDLRATKTMSRALGATK